MSKCREDCIRPTPFQAHCPTCHRHFGGVRAFDDHRSGGVCIDPGSILRDEEPLYVETDGIWRAPMDQEKVKAFRARVKGTR